MSPFKGWCPKNSAGNGTVKFCFGNYYRKSQVSSCPSLEQPCIIYFRYIAFRKTPCDNSSGLYNCGIFDPKILNI